MCRYTGQIEPQIQHLMARANITVHAQSSQLRSSGRELHLFAVYFLSLRAEARRRGVINNFKFPRLRLNVFQPSITGLLFPAQSAIIITKNHLFYYDGNSLQATYTHTHR